MSPQSTPLAMRHKTEPSSRGGASHTPLAPKDALSQPPPAETLPLSPAVNAAIVDIAATIAETPATVPQSSDSQEGRGVTSRSTDDPAEAQQPTEPATTPPAPQEAASPASGCQASGDLVAERTDEQSLADARSSGAAEEVKQMVPSVPLGPSPSREADAGEPSPTASRHDRGGSTAVKADRGAVDQGEGGAGASIFSGDAATAGERSLESGPAQPLAAHREDATLRQGDPGNQQITSLPEAMVSEEAASTEHFQEHGLEERGKAVPQGESARCPTKQTASLHQGPNLVTSHRSLVPPKTAAPTLHAAGRRAPEVGPDCLMRLGYGLLSHCILCLSSPPAMHPVLPPKPGMALRSVVNQRAHSGICNDLSPRENFVA